MDFANMNLWCWLIPVLCTLLGALFGYWLGSSKKTVIEDSPKLLQLQKANTQLQADLTACREGITGSASLAAMDPVEVEPFPFDAQAASKAMGVKIKNNDLKVVEGIGPKIEKLFQEHGIATWEALSNATVAQCRTILDDGGDQYKLHDPASWPMQAKMCHEGEWKILAKWQHEHKHGKL